MVVWGLANTEIRSDCKSLWYYQSGFYKLTASILNNSHIQYTYSHAPIVNTEGGPVPSTLTAEMERVMTSSAAAGAVVQDEVVKENSVRQTPSAQAGSVDSIVLESQTTSLVR